MRSLLLLLVAPLLLTAAAQAQSSPDTLALPDSSYLFLTLDMPSFGTFEVVQLTSGSNRRRTIMYEIRSVEVVGCVLRWRSLTRTHDEVRTTRAPMIETQVPLKVIDLKKLDVRPALAPAGSRFEPPAYEIITYALDRRARPITTRNMENGITTRQWQATLHIGQEADARRVSEKLADAARRCDTWRTAPIPVIRAP